MMSFRLALVLLFVLLCAASGYRITTLELARADQLASLRAFEADTYTARLALMELRAAQQAYVAAGQGDAYWHRKVEAGLAELREMVGQIRSAAVSGGALAALDGASGVLGDLEHLDRRVRDYVGGGQQLLASDLIFADGLEMVRSTSQQIEAARIAERHGRETAMRATRTQEAYAAAAAAGGALVCLLLLLRRRTEQVAVPAETAALPARSAGLDLRQTAPSKAADRTPDLQAVADLCAHLARVEDSRVLPDLLARAASVLEATGIVIWLADPAGTELTPVLLHGYAQEHAARMPAVRANADNATAVAFRTRTLQVVNGSDERNGAIVAPLVGAGGCIGVFAAEGKRRSEENPAARALAMIVAAQLSTLLAGAAPAPAARAESR